VTVGFELADEVFLGRLERQRGTDALPVALDGVVGDLELDGSRRSRSRYWIEST
jgi:hypothetical protein